MQKHPNAQRATLTAVILVVVLAIAAYFFVTLKPQQNTDESTPVATTTPTATPTPTPSPSPTPTPATATPSTEPTVNDTDFGFTFQHPKEWFFYAAGNCEGLCHRLYQGMTKNSTNASVYDEMTITVSVRRYGDEMTLDSVISEMQTEQQRNVQNITNTTIGNNIQAKRFDDGGGLLGFMYSTLVVKGGTAVEFRVIKTSAAESDPAGFKKMLETFRFK